MEQASQQEEVSLNYIDMRDFSDQHINAIISALHFQHRLFLREMKGALLPAEIPLDKVRVVMDFVCGPGAWCVDFSKSYPDKQIYGLDCNHKIVALASENIRHASPGKLTFQSTNRVPPLLFNDETFDLIHIQNGTSLFTQSEWPSVIAEMYRLLKPGGWLNLVDFEMGPVSQPALDHVLGILGKILARLDRNITAEGTLPLNGCTLGPQRMAWQGFTEIDYHLYPVNLGGWNNPIGRAYLHSIVVRPEMLSRLALETQIASEEALRPLLQEMQRELQQIGFCGAGMLISSFGRKPAGRL